MLWPRIKFARRKNANRKPDHSHPTPVIQFRRCLKQFPEVVEPEIQYVSADANPDNVLVWLTATIKVVKESYEPFLAQLKRRHGQPW